MAADQIQRSRAIWNGTWSLDQLHELTRGTLVEHLGIEFTSIEDDELRARLAVRPQTAQRLGFLHGGASLALAETVGSIASQMCIDPGFASMGLEINANHVRPAQQGQFVEAIARPIHLGRKTQIWDVRVESAEGKLVCIARLTTSIQASKT
ncbi:PaaI family thioesterase [Paraburkholderia caribensis]|uniref:PaaI family thioesterase n=1 Tax=Paraburkholderia caribensis TaxID=75105 RepID=UPI0034D234BD